MLKSKGEMPEIQDIVNNLKSLNVDRIVLDAIERTKDDMIALNIEQLSAGHDSNKKRLRRYRSKTYAENKNRQNPAPGLYNPDLILTGAFVASLSLNIAGDGFEFSGSDSKSPELLEKYGDDVLGLSDPQQEYYNEEIFFPEMAGDIEAATGLKFE